MKYKVQKAFIDKHTDKPYNPGYGYETNDTDRAGELIAAGYLVGNLPEKAKPKQKIKVKDEQD